MSDKGTPTESLKERVRRSRQRARPVTGGQRATRARQTPPPFEPPIDEEGQYQKVDLELRPVTTIFGTTNTVEITAREDEAEKQARQIRRRLAGETPQQSLLKDPNFRLLWLSRLFSQTAQGALLYALMILVVDLSNRSFFVSVFVACSNVASIGLGLPAGMVVDSISRRFLLTMLNCFRFAFMLMMVAIEPTLGSVFACTIGIWIIHQFYSPCEASILADVVPKDRYTSAQSLHNLALTISQGVGLAILAPLGLRIGGAQLVFVMAGALWLIAGAFTSLLPSIAVTQSAVKGKRRRSFMETLTAGLQFIRRDRPTLEAILDDVLVSLGMSALVVIIPFYLERVLQTSRENTVFVFAPAAIGMVVGLRLAPILAKVIGERLAAFASVCAFGGCILALGFVDQMYVFLNDVLRLPLMQLTDWLRISPTVFLTMLITIPAGMALSVVNVAARSILLHRSPQHVRGQVIASQGLIGNVMGLIPTLLAGLATDLFGVIPVAIAIAILIIAGGIYARSLGRSEPDQDLSLAPA